MIYIRYTWREVGFMDAFDSYGEGVRVSIRGCEHYCRYSIPFEDFVTLVIEAQQRHAILDLTEGNMPNVRQALAGTASFSEAFMKQKEPPLPPPQPLAAPAPGM